MHKVFIPIYRFFKSRQVLMYLVMAVTFVVFATFGLQLHFEEDISKLLPTSSVESQLAFGSIGLKDKVFIQVTSSEGELAPEEIGALTDDFMDLLFEKDADHHYISNILYKMEPEMALNALDFVLEHLPSFVDTSAYAAFGQAMVPEVAAAQMQADYDLLMNDETGDALQMIAYDPLNLKDAVIGDLLQGAMGGYNILDGHFFCADSTVAIAYLAPAFKTLDSKAARDFARLMTQAQREFETLHPEAKVLVHGDPIGSVSNAGRIRSDLVVTVGISLVLILILLGLCFKSLAFMWKLLLPIVYGTAFSLAVIYWYRGGNS